jgi:hypothetical protein
MPINDLAIRYTDDQYATKLDVSRALGTSIVEAIWQSIQSYRTAFSRVLPILSIDKQPLVIVLTPSILEKVQQCERKLMKVYAKLASIRHTHQLSPSHSPLLLPMLGKIADHYGASTAERNLQAILDKKNVDRTAELQSVHRYFLALDVLASRRQSKLDEDFLGEMLLTLQGQQELTTFYREKDLTARPRSLVDKIYEAAPFMMIEPMMTTLIQTISTIQLPSIIVATIALYYMLYIKPFEGYNDEIALLTFKNILIHSDYEAAGVYANLEQFIEHEGFESRLREVQKTHDITYLLDFLMTPVLQSFDSFLDIDVSQTQTVLTQEQRGRPQEQAPSTVAQPPISVASQITFSPDNFTLSEVAASRFEDDLKETHPSMKSSEAYFYARHHTLVKYYTIAQFKKTIGCAYETARTAMEHLVKLGYYRKEQYKNKFVYTPQNQGESL